MSAKDDGGPAFPLHDITGSFESQQGMSLRDYFAAKYIVATASPDAYWSPSDEQKRAGLTWANVLAHECYEVADAMLAERSK